MQTVPRYQPETRPDKNTEDPDSGFKAFAHVAEQNAINAAFLWLLRSQAARSRLFYSADIQELDDRIEGSLDGISTVGELGWQLCTEQMDYEEPGETFTAAVVAFRSHNTTRIKETCERALTTPAMTRGLISALGWIEPELAETWIPRFLSVTDPNYRFLGLAACSVRRQDPGPVLLTILQDPETEKHPRLHARALRLIGELKRWDLSSFLNAAMGSEQTEVKFWTNWSAVLLGDQAAARNLKPWVLEDTDLSDKAIQLAFSVLPGNEARRWISELDSGPDLTRHTITAIGVLGDPQAIPWLLQQMADPEHTRLAGWALSQITGIDLEAANLIRKPPETHRPGPSDDPSDEDMAMDKDEELPWPDRKKITDWWQAHMPEWQAGQRYFQGQPVTPQVLAHVLASANQQQKELTALQLALFDKPAVLIATKAREQKTSVKEK